MSLERDRTHTIAKRNGFVLGAIERRFGAEKIAASGLSILDLGCGGGEMAEALGRAGLCGVFGIDPDPRAVQTARRRCGRFGHRFQSLAVEDFDAAPVNDVILLCEVLMHVKDPRATLAAMRRWVQPGGLVILTIPNAVGPWARYRAWLEREALRLGGEAPSLGRNRFRATELGRLIDGAGFRVERWSNSNFLSPVYPFSVSRYRPERFGFIERADCALADFLPRCFASGWYLSLVPSRVRAEATRPAGARMRAGTAARVARSSRWEDSPRTLAPGAAVQGSSPA